MNLNDENHGILPQDWIQKKINIEHDFEFFKFYYIIEHFRRRCLKLEYSGENRFKMDPFNGGGGRFPKNAL